LSFSEGSLEDDDIFAIGGGGSLDFEDETSKQREEEEEMRRKKKLEEESQQRIQKMFSESTKHQNVAPEILKLEEEVEYDEGELLELELQEQGLTGFISSPDELDNIRQFMFRKVKK